jgi:hypothetical protein
VIRGRRLGFGVALTSCTIIAGGCSAVLGLDGLSSDGGSTDATTRGDAGSGSGSPVGSGSGSTSGSGTSAGTGSGSASGTGTDTGAGTGTGSASGTGTGEGMGTGSGSGSGGGVCLTIHNSGCGVVELNVRILTPDAGVVTACFDAGANASLGANVGIDGGVACSWATGSGALQNTGMPSSTLDLTLTSNMCVAVGCVANEHSTCPANPCTMGGTGTGSGSGGCGGLSGAHVPCTGH